ncbi:TIGR01777 family oxidoreductase [Niabella insulamsoli]|uniref:TIGR01777 family oxidoreductase n=1 Tax=Niabella insulamsoli TaxID=3144874 RepID=UPI0031FC8A1A
MSTVLITGGTGMIGSRLVEKLKEKGHSIIVLTRSGERQSQPGIRYAQWDVEEQKIDEAAVAEADIIIHLAGANVGEKRWTAARKKAIVDSRVKSGHLLVTALQSVRHKVKAFVSASAIGWYGSDPDIPNTLPFDESFPAVNDFLGTTCYQWEQSISPIGEMGIRLVILRTGIVLSNEGGAFREFRRPLRFGAAPVLGSGKQIVSWIHIDDLIELYIRAVEDALFSGVYNAVAPDPVSNRILMKTLSEASGKRFLVPVKVPEWALKVALGEMSVEVLKSTTVSSARAQEAGFKFSYPTIQSAVAQLLR